jgi:hypothetical protein
VSDISSDDLKLLREIIAQGGRKYTAGSIDRKKYDHEPQRR